MEQRFIFREWQYWPNRRLGAGRLDHGASWGFAA